AIGVHDDTSACHHIHLHAFPTRRSSDLCLENWRHAVQNNRQRLLRKIERRFLTPNLSRRRSRCDSIVCRDLTQRNSMNWSRWSVDRKSTRLNSSHGSISYAVFCLKKKKM